LTAEKAVLRVKNGQKQRVWQKTRARNEALDVRVYALSAFVNLNANLDQLAKSLKAKSIHERKTQTPQVDTFQAIKNRPPRLREQLEDLTS
jgi:phage terminase large subunit GpA-like protein